MTTGAASGVSSFGAVVTASYAAATGQPYEPRIEYGTSSTSLTDCAYYNDGGLSAPSGSFSVTLSSLSPNTTYFYRAVIQIGNDDVYGDMRQFTTAQQSSYPVAGWLELPKISGSEDYVGTFYVGSARNYTYNYDYGSYTALWVAYPLYASTTSGSGSGSWAANPNLPVDRQINVWKSSYNVNVGSTSSEGYTSTLNFYARGHQVPNADRSGVSAMQTQTYYATNSTPQIQNKFNGGIWSGIENAVRGLIPQNDTLYVVTGAAFNKPGENKPVVKIMPSGDSKQVPVPNYYWKVLLKVKRNAGGNVTAASTVGIWIDHREHDDTFQPAASGGSPYVVSVDQIEAWTGFDFFAALPSELQSSAESNVSWNTFTSF